MIDPDTGEELRGGRWHNGQCASLERNQYGFPSCNCRELTEEEAGELMDCDEMKSGTLEE